MSAESVKKQGKTDVAMLTILRVINQHRSQASRGEEIPSTICRGAFKIIYVYAYLAFSLKISANVMLEVHP